jgi:arylsulfatase A-like enzyme
MGEKTFFHDAAIKIPLIIYDPSPQADNTRGTVCDALVESIDLTATFIEAAGGTVPSHIVEGRSLLPILHGTATETAREFAICEYDYSASPLAGTLGVSVAEAVMFCVITKDWKLIHFEGGFRPMLFDLANDPQELTDLGASPAHADIRAHLYNHLDHWARRPAQRTTRSEQQLIKMRTGSRGKGVVLGIYDETEADAHLTIKYRGRKATKMT